jgi:hypothetical protein
MTTNHIPAHAIPDWLLDSVRVMGDVDHMTRDVDNQLRHAMELKGLDARLRHELQYLRDALGAVKTGLSLMDMTARKVVADLSAGQPDAARLVSVG